MSSSCPVKSPAADAAAPVGEHEQQQPRQTLGERMKTYEHETKIDPNNAFLVRLDGKTFSSFTGKFNKPFDPRFTRAMVQTTQGLLQFFSSATAFCCSDEITLVHAPVQGNMQEHPFNGRKNKIATLAAGKCSTLFLLAILDECKDDPDLCDFIVNKAPCFDARVMEIPMPDAAIDVAKNIYWRSSFDCRKNTTSSYARFLLGTKGSQNKHSGQMVEAMKVCGIPSEENIKYVDKSCATLRQIASAAAAVSGSGDVELGSVKFLQDEAECLIHSEHGGEPVGFDFTKIPTYKMFGVIVKKVVTEHTNEDGERYLRHKPQNFAIEILTKDFEEVTKLLLLPKLVEEDIVMFGKSINLQMVARL